MPRRPSRKPSAQPSGLPGPIDHETIGNPVSSKEFASFLRDFMAIPGSIQRSVPFTVHPAHREGLAASGLSDLGTCRSFTGGAVVKAKRTGRTTVRFEAAGRTYFLKR